jgi:hypothetical protein
MCFVYVCVVLCLTYDPAWRWWWCEGVESLGQGLVGGGEEGREHSHLLTTHTQHDTHLGKHTTHTEQTETSH